MQMVETKYLMTRPGPMGSHGQTTAAATFFAKANQACVRFCLSHHYRAGRPICRKVLKIMFWEVPPADWLIL